MTDNLDNPIGIHCVECTVDNPCELCADQIAAEAAYVRDQAECIVDPMRDGPTLWDCECRECRALQRDAEEVHVDRGWYP